MLFHAVNHVHIQLSSSCWLGWCPGPREATEIFLEIYGNHMLRKQTSAYLQSKIEELIRFLTDGEGILAKLIDTSLLKFKQRDAIEKVRYEGEQIRPKMLRDCAGK